MNPRILRFISVTVAVLAIALLPTLISHAQFPTGTGAQSVAPAPATEKRVVVSDLAERLAKFKNVKMPFDRCV